MPSVLKRLQKITANETYKGSYVKLVHELMP